MESNIYIKRDRDDMSVSRSLNLGGLDSFWHLHEENNGYVLTCEDYVKTYPSMAVVNKYFISLEEFLHSGKYIGLGFQRTKIIKDSDEGFDSSYTKYNRLSVYIALFEKDGIILAYYLNDLFDYHKYVVIPKYYTQDGNYELAGKEPMISFRGAIYDEIIKQESEPKNKELTLQKDLK